MSGRLASFRGPSTPTSSPVQHRTASGSVPSSPSSSRVNESTYHRKTRTLLQELRTITETWDDLVLIDGLKAAKSLVDTRTDLDNALSLIPDRLPRSRMVTPKLAIMEKRIVDLENTISKLQKQFRRMCAVIENFEALVIEAHKNKGWQWVEKEPLWTTWSLNKFASTIPDILVPYHRSLNEHVTLVNILRSHSTPFETSRIAIAKWAEQAWLEDSSWEMQWEDLCAAEVDHWNSSNK
ncbi:hypothetical protein E1B28_002593 [Marasmius oreades]|uniref:Uncharacterized protein n=1 Tax=Marasmius oreades TaxID=181124 RepID=A0A9P7RMY1_9AGAR|nr:uncharacterized protein E1B28_002593 [Marasmius oreades]KAG7086654.1 hypothetical protein E1B28_002593 [Marasmius oreades]